MDPTRRGPDGDPPPHATARRVLEALEWTAVALLTVFFVWKGLIPAWGRLNTDFPNYYLAARLYRAHAPLEHLYDWVWFQRQKDHAAIDQPVVGYVPLSPFSALIVAPLASLPPLVAKRWWLGVNLLVLGGVLLVLRRLTRLPARRSALIVMLCTMPLQTSFAFGQQHLLVLFLLAAAAWLFVRGREGASGAVVAVAAALKLYPVLFAGFFLLKGRWRALFGLCGAAVLLAAASLLLFGTEAMRVYVTAVLPRSLAGEGNDPYHLGFNTPAVLLRHLFVAEPALNDHPVADAPWAFAILQPALAATLVASALWFLTPGWRRDPDREPLEWGAFVALLLVSSTSSSTYHFCALILATALAADFLRARGDRRLAAVVVALHALVCGPVYALAPAAPSGWEALLGVPRLYALLAYWGLLLWVLARAGPSRPRRRWEAAACAATGAILAAWGVHATAQRVLHQREPGAERLPESAGALVSTGPAVVPQGVYFSAMEDLAAYVVDRTPARLATRPRPGLDLFHPTAAPALGVGWVEVSSAGGSHVARFRLDAGVLDAPSLPVAVGDAEQPTASPDGHRLAFLREEEQTRAGLWIAPVVLPSGAVDGARARKLADASYDVLEAAFLPDGRVVFSGGRGGAPRLFVTTADPPSTVAELRGGGPGRYPAASPDGLWLAFATEERGAWQLRLLDLSTGERRRLPHTDCNAITPAWTQDGARIVYATDCRRNVGDTALAEVPVSAFAAGL